MRKTSPFLLLTILVYLLFTYNLLAEVTIEDVIEEAQTNNNNIKLQNYRLEAVKTLRAEAMSAFLPHVQANLRYGQKKDDFTIGDKTFNPEGIEEVKIEQPLFDGMRSVSKYQEADYKIKSATSEFKDKKQEIGFKAANSYLELFRAQEILTVQKENKELAENFFSLVKKRRDARLVDEAEIIKFTYESDMLKEKYLNSLNKFSQAQSEYQNIIGRIDGNLSAPTFRQTHFDKEQIIAQIISNNHVLKSYKYNYLASKFTYKAEKSRLLPSVSATASTSKQKNVDYLRGKNLRSKTVAINVSIPIFQQGIEYAGIIKAKNQSLASLKEYEINRDNLIKEVNKLFEEYNYLLKLNKNNLKLAELAKNRENIIKKRFKAGIEDPIDLIRTQIEMNDYKVNYINSRTDLAIAYYKLKYYLGEINGAHN